MALGDKTAAIPFWSSTYWGAGIDASANYYGIADWSSSTQVGTGTKPFASVPVVDALAIDKKIDDGNPTTGIVLGFGSGGGGGLTQKELVNTVFLLSIMFQIRPINAC